MAEEKKRKIDLKARLGKAGAAAAPTPPPGQMAAIPVPMPVPSSPSRPPPPTPSRPPPIGMGVPGVLVGPPPPFSSSAALDPNNPLSAVASPYRPATQAPHQPAPAQPQRIEIDESSIQQATSRARKQVAVFAGILALVGIGIGYVAGTSSQQGTDRQKSADDAKDLAKSATAAKTQLQALSDKLEAGYNTLGKDHKFPDTLASDLGAIHVDFDGTQLAGRRFSGFSTDTMSTLLEFITQVQALNDRKDAVTGLLTKLKGPITEQLAHAGQQTVSFVVVGDKDPSGNAVAYIAPLVTPISVTPPQITLPASLTFINPLAQGNADAPPFKSGDITANHQAMYVAPKTFDTVCPNEAAGQSKQLAAQISGVIHDIKGDAPQQDVVNDAKPGLIDQASKLIDGLNKVGNK
ncbi:MAG: hypothetical protein ABI461_11680 [Polyangiaceae bacterium]